MASLLLCNAVVIVACRNASIVFFFLAVSAQLKIGCIFTFVISLRSVYRLLILRDQPVVHSLGLIYLVAASGLNYLAQLGKGA